MKKRLLLGLVIAFTTTLKGQDFTFESGYSNCTGKNSTLSLSSDHYKEGQKSLCWQTQGGKSQLSIAGFSVLTTSSNCANMEIYAPSITNDTLYVEFLYNNKIQKSGRFLMNYKGWHEFKRWYIHYQNAESVQINEFRLTLLPTDQKERKIFIDDIHFNQAINNSKDILGSHWTLDFDQLAWVGARLDPHYLKDPYRLYGNVRDIPLKTPTPEELEVLTKLRAQFKLNLKFYSNAYSNALSYLESLQLERNSDNTLHGGPVLTNHAEDITLDILIGNSQEKGVLEYLKTLATGVVENKSNAKTYFNLLFDYVIDQGLGEGCPIFASSNAYDNVRNLTNDWYQILYGCSDDDRYQECLKAMKWFSYYGVLYNPEDSYLYCINSDVLYLLTQPIMNAIVSEKDDAVAVRELYAFKRYLDRSVRDVPGGNNMIKPDGTGFHHATHYINYMRAYTSVTDAMAWLKGTPFKVDKDSYMNFRKAILANYSFATKHNGDNHSYALSLAGRHPFGSNHNLSYSKEKFESLILVGRDCLGMPHDTLLENAYNYYFKSSKYDVPVVSLDGFYAYNYSPAAIYRGPNWHITMRCPTSVFWGSEIYPSANRYGRYQSHGSLDVNYDGEDFSASGYPTNETGAGWDWNCPPGATTVHYKNWKELSPNQDANTRMDQYNEYDFSGALALDKSGMFGCHFLQRESWTPTGKNLFPSTSTNLSFKKSMFCFDEMVIALGSDIQTDGTYPSDMLTATTLFQEIITDETTNLSVNGENKSKGFSSIYSSRDNLLVTPHGTGFIVPKTNDQLKIQYQSQVSPNRDGSDIDHPTTSLTAAKAFLMHGYKGTGAKKYHYLMKPATTAQELTQLYNQWNKGELYNIKQQDGKLHAVYYLPQKTYAYCFFEAIDDLDFGILKQTTGQHLLMIRQENEEEYTVAVANPNLNPQTDSQLPYNFQWLPKDTHTILTFEGIYSLETKSDKARLISASNNQTCIEVTFSEGFPVYFRLIKDKGTGIRANNDSDNKWIHYVKSNYLTLVNSNFQGSVELEIYSSEGTKVNTVSYYIDGHLSMPIDNLKCGVYVCHLKYDKSTHIFKIIV